MGQYHKLISRDANEFIDHYKIGAGAKMFEQTHCYGSVRAALAVLASRRPGTMPADIGYSNMVGLWAGHRILSVGDYAEDGDITPWDGPVSLPSLYRLTRPAPEFSQFVPNKWPNPGEIQAAADLRGQQEYAERKREYEALCALHKPLTDIAPKLVGVIESVCNVRFKLDKEGWRSFVFVRALASKSEDGIARFDLVRRPATSTRIPADLFEASASVSGGLNADQIARFRSRFPGAPLPPDEEEYWARLAGFTPDDWTRAPLDHAHHGMRESDIDLGQRRVWVNLDRREFVDPIAFGEPPTTAGIMQGEHGGSAFAVLTSTFHPERRGGGDMDISECGIVGRWRNHRLALTAETEAPGSTFPTTSEALASFENVSSTFVKEAARGSQV